MEDNGFLTEQALIEFKLFGEDSLRQANKDVCGNLSVDGRLCGRDFKKTNSVKCELCKRIEKNKEEERAREHQAFFGYYFHDPITVILNLKKQVSDLSKPQQGLLDRIAKLENMKDSLLSKLEEMGVLETDNDRMRKEIEELSKDPLVEKNASLTVEIGKLNGTIEALKTQVEKNQALADTRRDKLNSVVSQFSKALRDFKEYCPTTADPYQMHDYIDKMQKKCQDLEGFINTLTA
jgi:vacuolar-type H+-ATPase subunit I/STV1